MDPVLLAVAMAAGQWVSPGPNQVAAAWSPNFGVRPEVEIDVIVLHHTASSTMESVVNWFSQERSRVSSHFTVGKDGAIAMHVPTYLRAWHAGASVDALGREDVNDFSVGIEIVNKGDGSEPYTDEQVAAVRLLCAWLVRQHPVRLITSHKHIARPQGRKNDPIDYPWSTLDNLGVDVVP